MESKYVYLLWTHNEDGVDDLAATLDINRLPDMAKQFDYDGYFKRPHMEKLVEELRAMLPRLEGSPQDINLTGHWGGLHAQVVQLT